jgi:hypothetical protein
VRRRFPQPAENRIFFVAGRAGDTADAIPFGQLGERFDNVIRRSLAPIKQRPFRRRERAATGATLIALLPIAGATKLDDVPLLCSLRFPVSSALWIRAEIARLG